MAVGIWAFDECSWTYEEVSGEQHRERRRGPFTKVAQEIMPPLECLLLWFSKMATVMCE
jgi:hypothetical protein